MKSYMAKAETMERKWYVVDAEGMVLGSSRISGCRNTPRKTQAHLYPAC